MNKFGICEKCLGSKTDEVRKKLKEIDSSSEIIEGCQNMCGIGRTKPFAIVNHIPVIATDIDELIQKIKAMIK